MIKRGEINAHHILIGVLLTAALVVIAGCMPPERAQQVLPIPRAMARGPATGIVILEPCTGCLFTGDELISVIINDTLEQVEKEPADVHVNMNDIAFNNPYCYDALLSLLPLDSDEDEIVIEEAISIAGCPSLGVLPPHTELTYYERENTILVKRQDTALTPGNSCFDFYVSQLLTVDGRIKEDSSIEETICP